MSTPAIVWLVVGLVSLVALIAVFIGLIRHLLLLARTLGRFQEEVKPVAEEIASGAGRAGSRAERLRGDRSGRG